VRRLLSRFSTTTLMGLAFTVPTMLITVVLLAYNARAAHAFVAAEGVRYGEILSDQMLSASQRFLRLGSVAAVQEMIEDTGSQRSVLDVALIGSDGRVIASNRRDWIHQQEGVIPDRAFHEVARAARETLQAQNRLVDGGRRIVLVSPLLLQGINPILTGSRGILYLRVDQTRRLAEIDAAILRRGTVSALVILMLSLLLLGWVRAILALPILRVAAYLRDFAAGAAGALPPLRGTREIARLVDDVSRMAVDLRSKQEALAASEERHRALLEGAYDAIVTVDPESGRILEANAMFDSLFGYAAGESETLGLAELLPPEERDRLLEEWRGGARLVHLHDVPCLRRDGTRFYADVRGGPIVLGSRTVMEWIVRDRTERRHLEEQLRQAQKMESVATLAGGMAHDFNNLLTGILGYTRLVMARMKPDDPSRKSMGTIERSSLRAAELTAQLQAFSRRAASRPQPADLNAVIAPVVEALRSELPARITLQVETASGLWTSAVDAGQIQQALRHLVTNACEAMPDGGVLSIATANRTLTEADCRGNLEARPGRFVTLTVADAGRGIDPAVRPRIFEPFFTTKAAGAGTGLGLAMVYGSIKGHDGWVEVISDRGRGARFVVHLPEYDRIAAEARVALESPAAVLQRLMGADAGAAQAAAAAASTAAGAGTAGDAAGDPAPAVRPAAPKTPQVQRTVLAVDDESTVLALARDILELHGYKVLTARNGDEAIRLFRKTPGAIDLVLLDLTMPVMDGRECLRQILATDPGARVIIASGFSADSTVHEVLAEGAIDYVQKPYDIDVLARVVRSALDKPPARPVARTA
jgi:PAS domain S-box-containing protein